MNLGRHTTMKTAAVTSVLFVTLWRFSQAAEDMLTVTSFTGQNAVLQCLYPNQDAVTKIAWTRQNLSDYVLFIRENRSYERYQNPAFVDRVQLRDPQRGDFSLDMKRVTANDTGVYECVVSSSSRARSRRAAVFRQTVSLKVRRSADSGLNAEQKEGARAAPTAAPRPNDPPTAGGPKQHFVLPLIGLVLVGFVVGFVIFKKYTSSKRREEVFTVPSENLHERKLPLL
ncbi:uncharacterized protein [Pempheris klunzingeri]|uniref:uncharacterized protein n=1 Tax=Pempheris klunzingeri TaxID=3127111 RepID=UPI00397F462C